MSSSSTKTVAVRSISTTTETAPLAQARDLLVSPFGLVLVCASLLAVLTLLPGQKSGSLGKAYWGGMKEKGNARKKGRSQVLNRSSKVGKTCLYINKPKAVRVAHRQTILKSITQALKERGLSDADIDRKIEENAANLPAAPKFGERERTVYFPDAQAGTAVLGAAGTGKSFGVLNPYLRSAVDQELSIVLYDFKYPEQSKEIAGYAKENGYNVQIFAPSFPETCTLNLLDYIKDAGDGVTAGQMAETIIKNLSSGNKNNNGNEFFSDAGVTLTKGLFLAAKWVAEEENRPELGDLMTAAAIAALPNLSARMLFARKRLNVWADKAFAQIVSVGGGKLETNVTEGGIVANAAKVFQKFVERDFVPAVCGVSDFQPDVCGKTLLIIGLNQDCRAILSPILATAIDTIVSRNIVHSRMRQTPLVVSLDELPSIYLPKLPNWLAEARSAGFVGLLGLQNFSQLKEAYGEDTANTILANCATKHFLNPQDIGSAEQYSKYLGETEAIYWTKSYNGASGVGSKGSVTRSQQIQKVPLMSPEQFLKLPQGRAVTISPGYSNNRRKEAYIPVLHDISIAPADIADSERSAGQWQKMLPKLQSQRPRMSDDEISKIMAERREIVERLFPLPPPADGVKTNLATLIRFAIEYLDCLPPDPNSYLDRDVSIYQHWMSGEVADLQKIQQDAEGLLILLAAHGIKLQKSPPTPVKV
jgi:type IV secretory pathway TraG/TraD family ATPase VirD4